jgi:hypothetical protein
MSLVVYKFQWIIFYPAFILFYKKIIDTLIKLALIYKPFEIIVNVKKQIISLTRGE